MEEESPARPDSRARSAAAGLVVLTAGLLLMVGLRAWTGAFTANEIFSRDASSESMVQTVSLLDLRTTPGETLLVLHIQPPLLDGLRALLARMWPRLDAEELVVAVDQALTLIWALLYALTGVIVFRWLERLLRSTRAAALAALLFLLHPAAIYYATFLEGTLPTAFGILWLSYALWSIPDRGATLSLGGAYLFLFFLRSIFQWPALVVLVTALLLRRAPRRTLLAVATSCALVVGAFMAKQYVVFGSPSTSSFAGSNCLNALGQTPESGLLPVASTIPMGPLFPYASLRDYPTALTRSLKITGAHNYNHVDDLRRQRELLRRCVERLATEPASRIVGAYAENASVYLRPSSRYLWSHALVDRLPWRPLYDGLFSGPRLVLLLVAGGLCWLHRHPRTEWSGGLGLALPVLFVAAVCVVFERGENMRFKFFVEPTLYVFLVAQLAGAWRQVVGQVTSRGGGPSSDRHPRRGTGAPRCRGCPPEPGTRRT